MEDTLVSIASKTLLPYPDQAPTKLDTTLTRSSTVLIVFLTATCSRTAGSHTSCRISHLTGFHTTILHFQTRIIKPLALFSIILTLK